MVDRAGVAQQRASTSAGQWRAVLELAPELLSPHTMDRICLDCRRAWHAPPNKNHTQNVTTETGETLLRRIAVIGSLENLSSTKKHGKGQTFSR